MLDFRRFDHQPNQIMQTPSVSLFDIEIAALIEAAFIEKEPESTQILFGSMLTESPKIMFDFRAYVEQTSNKVGDKRFMKGSLNSVKLQSSLAAIGNLDVLEGKLLQAQVDKKHASMLSERYLRKAKKWMPAKQRTKSSLKLFKKGVTGEANEELSYSVRMSHLGLSRYFSPLQIFVKKQQ